MQHRLAYTMSHDAFSCCWCCCTVCRAASLGQCLHWPLFDCLTLLACVITINLLLGTSSRHHELKTFDTIGTSNQCWLAEACNIHRLLLKLQMCVYTAVRALPLLCMLSTPCRKEAKLSQSSLQHKTLALHDCEVSQRPEGMCIAGDLLQLKRAVQGIAQSAGQSSAPGLQASAREALQYLATLAAG